MMDVNESPSYWRPNKYKRDIQAPVIDNLDHGAQAALIQLGRGRGGKRPIPEKESSIICPDSTCRYQVC